MQLAPPDIASEPYLCRCLRARSSLFVALPTVLITSIFVYKKEAEHNAHIDHEMFVFPASVCAMRNGLLTMHSTLSSEHNGGKAPKRVIYDYMNRRLKVCSSRCKTAGFR